MPERLRLVSLDCPNCGGRLPATLGARSLHCGHCDRDIIIDWGGRISAANYMALAKADFVLNNLDGAETEIRKALETNPDLAEAWFWKGLLTIQFHPRSADSRREKIAECLRRSQLTAEEAVTSLVTAGDGAIDLFYSTSLGIAGSILNGPIGAAVSLGRVDSNLAQAIQKTAGVMWYASSLLEASRRLDPEAAARKSTEIINYEQAKYRDRSFPFWSFADRYMRETNPLALGAAYHLGPQNHKRIDTFASAMVIGEEVKYDLTRYNLAVKILTFPPTNP